MVDAEAPLRPGAARWCSRIWHEPLHLLHATSGYSVRPIVVLFRADRVLKAHKSMKYRFKYWNKYSNVFLHYSLPFFSLTPFPHFFHSFPSLLSHLSLFYHSFPSLLSPLSFVFPTPWFFPIFLTPSLHFPPHYSFTSLFRSFFILPPFSPFFPFLRNPDVSWRRYSNPEPWQHRVDDDGKAKRYKFFQVLDHSLIAVLCAVLFQLHWGPDQSSIQI